MYSSKNILRYCVMGILCLSFAQRSFAVGTQNTEGDQSGIMHELELKIEKLKQQIKEMQQELEARKERATKKKEAKAAAKKAKQDAQIKAQDTENKY